MPRSYALLLALATLSATSLTAQNANTAEPETSISSEPSAPAPIQRAVPASNGQVTSSRPMQGVWLRADPNSSVQTLSANSNGTEIKVERGVANISVNHPAEGAEILVDLPGGQVALLKDGLYTFNASTDTIRVLHGEADAFPANSGDEGVKIKEDHQLAFGPGSNKAKGFTRQEARADLLNGGRGYETNGDDAGYYAPYASGFYAGGPYLGYGYPYAWGSPYGGFGPYGYPYGYGLGLGYYGGFRGGYYGGYGGGFSGFGGYGGYGGRGYVPHPSASPSFRSGGRR